MEISVTSVCSFVQSLTTEALCRHISACRNSNCIHRKHHVIGQAVRLTGDLWEVQPKNTTASYIQEFLRKKRNGQIAVFKDNFT